MIVAAAVCVAAAVSAAPAASAATPAQLLARYQPVTVLDPLERFAARRADLFAAAELERRLPNGDWARVPRPDALPTSDPAECASHPCWRLDFPGCAAREGLVAIPCYLRAESEPSVAYARFAPSRSHIVLQYWFFYYYDVWSPYYPPNDRIWRSHEGDWEQVTIVLSRAEKPLFAGYSGHCSGIRRAWATVPKWRRSRHPVVFVARGSHANYFRPGRNRIRDRRCYPQAMLEVLRVNRVGLDDFTGRGHAYGPRALGGVRTTELVRVTATEPEWMRFPGRWGEDGYFNAPGVDRVRFGFGPEGPAFHTSWRDPVRDVLRWPRG